MRQACDDLERLFSPAATIPDMADVALRLIRDLGFTSLVYDYSPVALSPEGELLTPSHLTVRDVPTDMPEMWCHAGYYQRDPVQYMALRCGAPFIWSYREHWDENALAGRLEDEHQPVVSYLHDADLTSGVTVPIRRGRGDVATFTAIQRGAGRHFERDARQCLATLTLAAQIFHEHAFPAMPEAERKGAFAHLTRRERECLRFSAEGLTAKEIAFKLNRSIPTVTLHLNTAARKLGARNRTHAVMLASHYRLLED